MIAVCDRINFLGKPTVSRIPGLTMHYGLCLKKTCLQAILKLVYSATQTSYSHEFLYERVELIQMKMMLIMQADLCLTMYM